MKNFVVRKIWKLKKGPTVLLEQLLKFFFELHGNLLCNVRDKVFHFLNFHDINTLDGIHHIRLEIFSLVEWLTSNMVENPLTETWGKVWKNWKRMEQTIFAW